MRGLPAFSLRVDLAAHRVATGQGLVTQLEVSSALVAMNKSA
jgi:hypothetical protein